MGVMICILPQAYIVEYMKHYYSYPVNDGELPENINILLELNQGVKFYLALLVIVILLNIWIRTGNNDVKTDIKIMKMGEVWN